MKYIVQSCLLLFILSGITSFSKTTKLSLIIEVTGLKTEQKGNLRIGIFDKPGFPKAEKALYGKVVPTSGSKMTVTFDNISPGKYAIAVVQDQDKNGKLTTNLVGYPTEPYGFSNNKFGNFGPPDFDEVAIVVKNDSPLKTSIQLK